MAALRQGSDLTRSYRININIYTWYPRHMMIHFNYHEFQICYVVNYKLRIVVGAGPSVDNISSLLYKTVASYEFAKKAIGIAREMYDYPDDVPCPLPYINIDSEQFAEFVRICKYARIIYSPGGGDISQILSEIAQL
jgi:hypothetical protein